MSLTGAKFSNFTEKLQKNKERHFDDRGNTLKNYDEPESGLDALMQVAACSTGAENIIGWRKDSLKMVVFMSVSGLHYAYDGQLGGIIIPNDMKCHMKETTDEEEQKYHTHYYDTSYERETDYPSFSQVRQKLHENDIKTVFAVTNEVLSLYKEMADFMNTKASVALTEGLHIQIRITLLLVKKNKKCNIPVIFYRWQGT